MLVENLKKKKRGREINYVKISEIIDLLADAVSNESRSIL